MTAPYDAALVQRVETAMRHAHDTAPAFRRWRDAAAAAVAEVRRADREWSNRPMVANSYRRPVGDSVTLRITDVRQGTFRPIDDDEPEGVSK